MKNFKVVLDTILELKNTSNISTLVLGLIRFQRLETHALFRGIVLQSSRKYEPRSLGTKREGRNANASSGRSK